MAVETENWIKQLEDNMSRAVLGKPEIIRFCITALLAGEHILLEDVPGVGKTLIGKTLAKSVSGQFRRIQFTPDLLPADITGSSVYDPRDHEFVFSRGPVFTNILLADEINRATPRTQSSLLEAMEERQVSIDGQTRPLEAPFFVIATQNPVETQGTYPLPEAQLDRFFLQLPLGYPDREEGIEILRRYLGDSPIESLEPVCHRGDILKARQLIQTVHVHESLLDYVMRITEATRQDDGVAMGVSPRGSIALIRGARALAAIRGRAYVIPEDIRELLVPVYAHRLILRGNVRSRTQAAQDLMRQIGDSQAVPTENWPER